MLALLVFILILSLLVIIHEAGHFFMARRHGVRVEEFGFGIPPRLFSKKVGDTTYSINLLPFGGFVKLTGEDADEQAENGITDEMAKHDPRNFASKTPWQRLTILIAGVFMNLVLALALFYLFFFINGFKSMNLPVFFDYTFKFGVQKVTNTVIYSFSQNSAALKAGLKPGEAVIEVNDTPVYSVADIRSLLKNKGGVPVKLLVMDLNQSSNDFRTAEVIPTNDAAGEGILGVFLAKSVVIHYVSPFEKNFAGFLHSYNMLGYSFHAIKGLIGMSVAGRTLEPVSEGVAGPVGIYSIVKILLDQGGKSAVLSLIDLTALMSLSLALVNIMPFPALDGGRVVFVLLEKVRGKKINHALESSIHKWGMMFLLGFLVLITVKDIFRIFG